MPRAQFAVPEAKATKSEQQPTVVTAPVRRSSAPVLRVGAGNDVAETEADRLADEVVSRLRDADDGGLRQDAVAHRSMNRSISRSSADAVGTPQVGFDGGELSPGLSSRIERARSGGATLSGATRGRMETAFGTNLGSVRLHHDKESATLNRMISARAFTTGQDIFFGAGQYRPETPDGEHMLAHELAHTRQQVGVHRIHRLWDMGAKQINWARTQQVGTVTSGQAVFFMIDGQDDRIVVKSENRQIGLGELSSVLHESLSNVKSVRHRKLSDTDRTDVETLLADDSKLEPKSWGRLGALKRNADWLKDELKDRLDAMTDVEVGAYVQRDFLKELRGTPMVAMSYAAGDTASTVGKQADPNRGNLTKPQYKTRMRRLLMDKNHMINIGQMTAVDVFLGNGDRATMGNMGNWIYDPHSAAMTAIDHVDGGVAEHFDKSSQNPSDMNRLLSSLAKKELSKTAATIVGGLAHGLTNKDYSGDTDIKAWLDEGGGYRRAIMEEHVEAGLVKGRALLVKTFSATRFSIGRSKSRALKKSFKKAGRAAHAVDFDGGATNDRDYYYQTLKARVAWLKKH